MDGRLKVSPGRGRKGGWWGEDHLTFTRKQMKGVEYVSLPPHPPLLLLTTTRPPPPRPLSTSQTKCSFSLFEDRARGSDTCDRRGEL